MCSPVGSTPSAAGAGAEQETAEQDQQWSGHLAVWSVLQVSSMLQGHLQLFQDRQVHGICTALPASSAPAAASSLQRLWWYAISKVLLARLQGGEGHAASALTLLPWQLVPLLFLPRSASGTKVHHSNTPGLVGSRTVILPPAPVSLRITSEQGNAVVSFNAVDASKAP